MNISSSHSFNYAIYLNFSTTYHFTRNQKISNENQGVNSVEGKHNAGHVFDG